MAISDILSRPVRARPDEDDVYSGSGSGDEVSDDGESEDEEVQSQESSDNDAMEDNEEIPEDDSHDDDLQATLNNISFGALAKAQASLGRNMRKQKHTSKATEESTSTTSPLDDIRARIREARSQKREDAGKAQGSNDTTEKKARRTSKHAPMVQSSKHSVSRKRTVVEPPAVPKPRDPRFDAAVMGHSGAGRVSDASSKAYAFLDEYRASELKDLKEQLGKTKNAAEKEELKREIRSATDRMRAMENKKRERDITAEHKKREKQLLREGKKSTPYYLKKSDLKKQVLVKKYEEMGSKGRAKALERRRKKMAAKERKDMPMERRALGDEPDEGRGGKRRRLA